MALTYKENITPYALGRRANMEEWNTITRTANGQIGFAVPVRASVVPHMCVEVAAGGENVLGITEASQVLPHPGDFYAEGDNVAICESGVIGVRLGSNVTVGDIARWNTANKTWTSAAQSATVVTIPGAQFEVAGTNGSIGLIRYRRPVPSLSVAG